MSATSASETSTEVIVGVSVSKAGPLKTSKIVAIGLSIAKIHDGQMGNCTMIHNKTYNIRDVVWPSVALDGYKDHASPECQFAASGYGSFTFDFWDRYWSLGNNLLFCQGPLWSVEDVIRDLWEVTRPFRIRGFASRRPYYDLGSIDFHNPSEHLCSYTPHPGRNYQLRPTDVYDVSRDLGDNSTNPFNPAALARENVEAYAKSQSWTFDNPA